MSPFHSDLWPSNLLFFRFWRHCCPLATATGLQWDVCFSAIAKLMPPCANLFFFHRIIETCPEGLKLHQNSTDCIRLDWESGGFRRSQWKTLTITFYSQGPGGRYGQGMPAVLCGCGTGRSPAENLEVSWRFRSSSETAWQTQIC